MKSTRHLRPSNIFIIFFFLTSTELLAQPANDLCSNATTLTVGAACTNGTTVAATTTAASDGTVTGCWATVPSHTVWYKFTTGTAGVYSISTDNGGSTDTELKLFTDCSGTLAPVGVNCNEDGGTNYSFAAVITTSLAASTTYYVMVDVYGGSTGTFCIGVTQAPANDLCTGAISLTIGASCTSGTNVGATTGGDPNPSCWSYSPSNTVWYKFVADDDSMTIDLGSGTLGSATQAAVYGGTCAAPGAILGCTNNSTQINLTTLTPGNTYYIMVDATSTTTGTFCITVFDMAAPNPPRGNSCSNPRTLFPGSVCNAVTGAQYDGRDNQLGSGGDAPASAAGYPTLGAYPDPTCTAGDNTQRAYWVDFIATSTTTTFTDNDPTNSYPVCATALDYAVFTGSCGSFTQVDCFSLGGSCGIGCCNPVTRNVTTVVGTHYYVVITPQGAGTTDTRFLCLTSATPSTPGNSVATDACASAPFINDNTTYTINNANATITGTEPPLCVGSSENTIFCQWTVPATWTSPTYVHLFDQDCNATLGMQLSVFALGTNCSSTSPSCVLATNPGNSNDYTGSFTASAGSTYLIALDGNAGAGCEFKFKIDNSAQTLLPVELISFNVRAANGQAYIKWSTASEINNEHFELERSSDGIAFETIYTAKGAGNSNRIINYETIDSRPLAGLSYYRLKQTDFNGKYSYSDVVKIKLKSGLIGNLHPNPANEFIMVPLDNEAESALLKIYNIDGKTMLEQTISEVKDGHLQIDLNTFPTGIYFMNIQLPDGNIVRSRFVKK